MNETTSDEKAVYPNSQLMAFLICVFISLLPGIVISASLFTHAAINDITMKHARDALPSTDLSQVRIEDYSLNEHITDYKPDVNLCDVTFENGETNDRYTDASSVYSGDSPIVSIDMAYPVVQYLWIFPLVWAIRQKKLGWTIATCVWYPLWYCFGVFMMLIQQ